MTEAPSIVHGGGDKFIMDGKTYDLQTLMMMLNVQRAEDLDKQLGDQLAVMKTRLDETKQLNQILNKVRSARPDGDGTAHINKVLTDQERGFIYNKFGVDVPPTDLKAAQWDTKCIEPIKGAIETNNSTSQMDTT